MAPRANGLRASTPIDAQHLQTRNLGVSNYPRDIDEHGIPANIGGIHSMTPSADTNPVVRMNRGSLNLFTRGSLDFPGQRTPSRSMDHCTIQNYLSKSAYDQTGRMILVQTNSHKCVGTRALPV